MVLVPHAGMGLMPLHAAWRMTESGRRAFLDDYTITYAPSVYALRVSGARQAEPGRGGESLLAIINPTGDPPFSEVEYQSVAAQFDTARPFGWRCCTCFPSPRPEDHIVIVETRGSILIGLPWTRMQFSQARRLILRQAESTSGDRQRIQHGGNMVALMTLWDIRVRFRP